MEVLKLLKDDENYYGELGRKYLSNSDIITLLNDPKNFRERRSLQRLCYWVGTFIRQYLNHIS